MTKKEKKNLIRIIISGLLFALSFIFKTKYVVFGILLVSYIIVGYDVLLKALI